MKKSKKNRQEKQSKQAKTRREAKQLDKMLHADTIRITDLIPLEKLKPLYIFGLATIIFFIDQLVKFYIRKGIPEGTSIEVLPFFHLTHLENSGTFFGLAQQSTGFLIMFTFIVIAIVLFNYKSIPEEKFLYVMTGFVLGGAFGNLYDRILFGRVTDYFDILIWPVFNVADMFITFAIIGLLWYAFRPESMQKK